MILNLILILICSASVATVGRRSLANGFCLALALIVALPATVRIDVGGSLPELTVHRILLLIVLIQWLSSPARSAARPPFFGLLLLVAATRAVSVLLSITPVPSVKDLFGFVLEVVVFYRVAYSIMVTNEGSITAAMRATVIGLTTLAAAVMVERYTSFSPLQVMFPGFPNDPDGTQGTYAHRILFGYAMAMGVPIAVCLLELPSTSRMKGFLWTAICLMAAACYFSNSRGPWIGLGIAMIVAGFLGGKSQRRRCAWIGLLVFATLLIRPGIWETMVNKYYETFDSTGMKAKSYQYRYVLWHVASSEISKSPERMLFGYGGLSTESMDLGDYFDAEAGGTIYRLGYTSWDNRYACDLIEFGAIGFALVLIIFIGIPVRLFRVWRSAEPALRPQLTGLLAAAAVFAFAQTNVDMFSVQLKFLFWALVAAGFGLAANDFSRLRQEQDEDSHSPTAVGQIAASARG